MTPKTVFTAGTGQEKDDTRRDSNRQNQLPLPETQQDLRQDRRQQKNAGQTSQNLKAAVEHGAQCCKGYGAERQTKQELVRGGKVIENDQIGKPAHQRQISRTDQ